MRTVIGLAGVKTSGKSTVAEMVKSLVPNAKEAALADKLKNVSAEVFGLDREQFDNQDLKEVPFDNPKLLDHGRIEQILTLFNVEPTQELMQTYYTNNVEGMLLETPRKIAQIVGTEVLRATGNSDIHCENVPLNNEGVTVISDLRFPNEYEYFKNSKDIFFIPLYIHRTEAEKHVTEDSHPSEKCVFEFNNKCVMIDNNGTLENTKAQVFNVLKDVEFGKLGGLNG